MFEAPHYSPAGAKRAGAFALPEPLFDGTVNEPVLHQTVKAYLNNQRQGTSATKTRSFVSGGNQKPWKQKGTGRARAGFHPRAALAGRWHRVRPAAARLPHGSAAQGEAARPQVRVQCAGA